MIYPNKLCCILFRLSWPKNTMVLLTLPLPLTSHDIDVRTKCQMIEKSSCSLWSSWNENVVVPLSVPLVSCDANTGITEPKSYFAPCFNCLDLTNKMVLLTIPSVLCDAHTGANSITWPKESCHTMFQLFAPKEQNDPTDDTDSITR